MYDIGLVYEMFMGYFFGAMFVYRLSKLTAFGYSQNLQETIDFDGLFPNYALA